MTSKKLRILHNYKKFSDNCKNCKYFKTDTAYHNESGIYADTCFVDADAHNPHQDVYRLKSPWGTCDDHERVPYRGKR